jgi:hypothetical protein
VADASAVAVCAAVAFSAASLSARFFGGALDVLRLGRGGIALIVGAEQRALVLARDSPSA